MTLIDLIMVARVATEPTLGMVKRDVHGFGARVSHRFPIHVTLVDLLDNLRLVKGLDEGECVP